jgi:hypothetical protein
LMLRLVPAAVPRDIVPEATIAITSSPQSVS